MTDILRVDPTLPPTDAVVAAALVIKAGGLIVFPTDTVYTIAADLHNAAAVQRLYDLKKRPAEKALPVLIGDVSQLADLADEVPDAAAALMDYYWPGPLTMIFKRNKNVPAEVTAGLPTIGIRMAGGLAATAIMDEAGIPLASSSANVSGEEPPRGPSTISPVIIDGVDMIIDGGICPDGQPSTILDVSGPVWRVLRLGRVTREALETAAGRVVE